MSAIETGVEIARSPEEVFAYVTDPSRFGEWQEGVVSGHIEADGAPAVGDKCVMTRRIGGAERTSTSEITEISPPSAWAIRGIDGPIRATVHVRVDRAGPHGSRVTIGLEFAGHGIGKMLVPMVVSQARREMPRNGQRLKQRLEAG